MPPIIYLLTSSLLKREQSFQCSFCLPSRPGQVHYLIAWESRFSSGDERAHNFSFLDSRVVWIRRRGFFHRSSLQVLYRKPRLARPAGTVGLLFLTANLAGSFKFS